MYDEINATETTLQKNSQIMKMRVGMCQTTSNLACLKHSFMIIMITMLSLYNVTLQGTNGIAIEATKREFNGIVSHTSEPSTSSRRSFKPVSQELQPYIKSTKPIANSKLRK